MNIDYAGSNSNNVVAKLCNKVTAWNNKLQEKGFLLNAKKTTVLFSLPQGTLPAHPVACCEDQNWETEWHAHQLAVIIDEELKWIPYLRYSITRLTQAKAVHHGVEAICPIKHTAPGCQLRPIALIHNDISGVQWVRSYDNLGQNAAFLLLPHGNSVPAHPDFDQGIEKIMYFYDSLVYLVASVPLNDVIRAIPYLAIPYHMAGDV